MRHPALVALALAVVAGLVGIVLAATDEEPRVVVTNRAQVNSVGRVVGVNNQYCQPMPAVPADAGAVRLQLATGGRPTPPLDVALGTRRAGHLDAGWREGVVTLPLSPGPATAEGTPLCVRNGGTELVAIAGAGADIRADFLLAGERSLAGSPAWLGRRFGQGKPDWLGGSWTLYVAVALALGAAVGGVAIAARGITR